MAVAAVGTRLEIGANTVAELSSIGGLELSADTIETTALDTQGGYRTFIGGFKDAGEVPLSGFFQPGDTNGQMAIYQAFQSGTVLSMTIRFPAALGAFWSFNAVVTKFATKAETEGAVPFEATLKVSGQPTLSTSLTADLTALTVTGGTLTPALTAGLYTYTVAVSGTSLTVTPTLASATIRMVVDGAFVGTVTSGAASSAVAFPTTGMTKEIVLEVQTTGNGPKRYRIVAAK